MPTDATIITSLIHIVTTFPLHVVAVLFFGALILGIIKLELSKY